MDFSKALILIPARFESTRFPGKPLAPIAGKSMIQRVYENAQSSGMDIAVVTDDSRIENHIQSFQGNVCRVDDPVATGSARIFLAYERFFQKTHPDSLIINVQGDEPLLTGDEIKRLYQFHRQPSSPFAMATLVKKRTVEEEGTLYQNPHVVKAVFHEKNGECHYFSRSPVPHYAKDTFPKIWYQHIGVYSYSPEILRFMVKGSPSYFESVENLEQLRILDESLRIGAIKTDLNLISVDNPGDVPKVEGVLSGSF